MCTFACIYKQIGGKQNHIIILCTCSFDLKTYIVGNIKATLCFLKTNLNSRQALYVGRVHPSGSARMTRSEWHIVFWAIMALAWRGSECIINCAIATWHLILEKTNISILKKVCFWGKVNLPINIRKCCLHFGTSSHTFLVPLHLAMSLILWDMLWGKGNNFRLTKPFKIKMFHLGNH